MRLDWQNWEKVEAAILNLEDDAAYLALWELKRDKREIAIGRCLLSKEHLLPFLSSAESSDFDSDDPDGPQDGQDLASVMGQPSADEPPGEPSREQLLRAAARYIQALAERSMGDEEKTRFRLRAFTEKGARAVDGGCFTIRNLDWRPPHDLPMPLEPLPNSLPAVGLSTLQTSSDSDHREPGPFAPYSALGTYYSQFGQVVINGVSQLQSINSDLIRGLYEQLHDSNKQRDLLVASIVDLRSSQVVAAEATLSEARDRAERNRLAERAIQELGESARTLLSAQGLPPDLLEIAALLGRSPELMAALRDPGVKLLMQDPNNLKIVAGMLQQLGRQALAMGVHAQAQASPQPQAQAYPQATGYGQAPRQAQGQTATMPPVPPAGAVSGNAMQTPHAT